MRIIYNRFIPFGRDFLAINICGVLFAKGKCDSTTIRHEMIHTAQIQELAYIFFYLLYLIEWMTRLIICGNNIKAYHNISFEREAYCNQSDPEYLAKRRHYSFVKYFRTNRHRYNNN